MMTFFMVTSLTPPVSNLINSTGTPDMCVQKYLSWMFTLFFPSALPATWPTPGDGRGTVTVVGISYVQLNG
jgi:hypothetical protein